MRSFARWHTPPLRTLRHRHDPPYRTELHTIDPRRLAARRGQIRARRRRAGAELDHARRHRRQAPVHGGRHGRSALRRYAARVRALPARPAGHDVCGAPVDDPAVRGLFHGRGIERLLPQGAGRRRAGRVGGVRPGHAPRLRLRPPACHGRRRQGRRGDRLGRGHEDPVRPDSARQGVGVDDHERRRAAGAGRLRGRGRRAGRATGPALGDDPERHPQRVHGAQHLHLPAQAEHAHHWRHHRVHGAQHAQVQLDLDLGLPHAGGRRQPGARTGLHAGGRQGIRQNRDRLGPGRGRICAAAVVLLGDRHELLPRSRQDARRAPAVVPDHERDRRHQPQEPDAAHALPDQRLEPDRAGPVQQHRAHHHRGHGGGVRRHAEPAHQRARRSDCAADRVFARASRATRSSSSRKRRTSPTWSTPGLAAT